MANPYVEIKHEDGMGFLAYASVDILPGHIICEYVGEIF